MERERLVGNVSATTSVLLVKVENARWRGRSVGQDPISSLYAYLRFQISSTATDPVQAKQQFSQRSLIADPTLSEELRDSQSGQWPIKGRVLGEKHGGSSSINAYKL